MGKTEGTSETIWSDYETDEYAFWKENETDRIWWVERKKDPVRGPLEFTYDFKKIYNAWSDYPDEMTKEEKEIFDRGQPFWRDMLKVRVRNGN